MDFDRGIAHVSHGIHLEERQVRKKNFYKAHLEGCPGASWLNRCPSVPTPEVSNKNWASWSGRSSSAYPDESALDGRCCVQRTSAATSGGHDIDGAWHVLGSAASSSTNVLESTDDGGDHIVFDSGEFPGSLVLITVAET